MGDILPQMETRQTPSCGLARKPGSLPDARGGRGRGRGRRGGRFCGHLSEGSCLALVSTGPGSHPSLRLRTDYDGREVALSSSGVGTATLAVSFPRCGFLTSRRHHQL